MANCHMRWIVKDFSDALYRLCSQQYKIDFLMRMRMCSHACTHGCTSGAKCKRNLFDIALMDEEAEDAASPVVHAPQQLSITQVLL